MLSVENMMLWVPWRQVESPARCLNRQVRTYVPLPQFSAKFHRFLTVSWGETRPCGGDIYVRNGWGLELCEKKCLIAYTYILSHHLILPYFCWREFVTDL